jgi:hypothetical protein
MQGQRKGFTLCIIANMIAIGREDLGSQSNKRRKPCIEGIYLLEF